MSKAQDRIWEEVDTGRISEAGDFILEYIHYNGCDDGFIEELVALYFSRLENEE